MCLNIGTPKILNFPFVPNGKLIILGVPILKHFTVYHFGIKETHYNETRKNLYPVI